MKRAATYLLKLTADERAALTVLAFVERTSIAVLLRRVTAQEICAALDTERDRMDADDVKLLRKAAESLVKS